jgi:hypothetical protein
MPVLSVHKRRLSLPLLSASSFCSWDPETRRPYPAECLFPWPEEFMESPRRAPLETDTTLLTAELNHRSCFRWPDGLGGGGAAQPAHREPAANIGVGPRPGCRKRGRSASLPAILEVSHKDCRTGEDATRQFYWPEHIAAAKSFFASCSPGVLRSPDFRWIDFDIYCSRLVSTHRHADGSASGFYEDS